MSARLFHESFDLAKQIACRDEIGLDAGPFALAAEYDAKGEGLAKVQAVVGGAPAKQLANLVLDEEGTSSVTTTG
ncbi:hypothetical protein SAZ10_15270 [Mesorhizobium sp. BAC0120]|uniref:hypothetical protein n=1 Tax=Mesorhizobium sp. BAC0120 TaxID=3090670 RepID=UPI00298CFD2F|nr:hypothetical protein [Mesorhizobium sp. BAC0120]MDW6023120.1 hypothetical protein [Mesorhizobium sp. BAC0120]